MNLVKGLWFLKTQLTKWAYGHVGKQCYIGKAIFIQRRKGLFLGDRVRIYPGMRAELADKEARIVIGNNVSIGQDFHVVSGGGTLHIGNDVVISGRVHISNVDHAYQEIGVFLYDQDLIEKETVIGDGCFIGIGSVILPGTILGKQCVVGANSVVRGVFEDYSVIVGSPAKCVKQYSAEKQEWVRKG